MTTSDQSGPGPNRSEIDLNSGVIELRPKKPEANTDSDQNSPTEFNVHQYAPPGAIINLTEKAGSLFLPHVLNQFAIQAIHRKSDLIIFQCLVRFTLGFNRPICKASNNFIARWTGLHTPHIRRGLKNLKTVGLIKLVSPGNPAGKPTVYEVPIVAGLLKWKNETQRGSNMVAEPKRVIQDRSQQRNQTESTGKTSAVPKKEKEIKNRNTTLDQEILPFKLRDYISNLKPHRQRVEEEFHLGELLKEYDPTTIEEALDYVECGRKMGVKQREEATVVC
jgi:hypothetical protein